MLAVSHLCKEYPTPHGPLPILDDITFTLQRGDAVSIMGPSGSGKSTLLYILGTLDSPTSGSVTLDGQNAFEHDEKALSEFRNQQIGFVFQDHHLLPQCSVLENVLIPTMVANAEDDFVGRARSLLQKVGLSERLDHRPGQLSGGEKQRVAIARALIREPLLLLCDEPTGNLDRESADTVAAMLLDLHRQLNNILIVVTHSTDLAAMLPVRFAMRERQLQRL